MTTTPSTASQAPEVLTRQVAAWRAEVARLNDLIAHATGASQAPAVSRAERVAEQRLQMQERFANRPKTPATADFDLPAPNDAIEPQPQTGRVSYQDCGTGTQSVRQLAASMIQLNEPECELAFVENGRRINIYVKILRVLEQISDESGLTG